MPCAGADAGITRRAAAEGRRAARACLRRRRRGARFRPRGDRGIVAVMAGEAARSPCRPARRARHRRLPPGRLCGDARHPGRHDPELRRGGPGDRPAGRRSGRRGGAGPQPVPDHRPVPPGRRGERGAHRVLGTGRPRRRSAGCSSSRAHRATASRSSSADALEGACRSDRLTVAQIHSAAGTRDGDARTDSAIAAELLVIDCRMRTAPGREPVRDLDQDQRSSPLQVWDADGDLNDR